jgi:mannose-6-phosphate isomerase-like protein (cupin superfamily)
MDPEAIKQKLRDEGFVHVYEWTDKPGTKYPSHTHKGKVSFYVMSGSIQMKIAGIEVTVSAPERMDVPVGLAHTAKVGDEGCAYIVGEEIEGDS